MLDEQVTNAPRGRRGTVAVAWMIGFAALHAAGAVAAAVDVGPYTGVGAVLVNLFYTALPLAGALVTDAIVRPPRRRLPPRVVDLGAVGTAVLLTFVGVLGVVHQVGGLVGRVEQNAAEAAFELSVIVGAVANVPIALGHLRRHRPARRAAPPAPRAALAKGSTSPACPSCRRSPPR